MNGRDLEARVARLICVGFPGDDPETLDPRAFAEFGPGGLIVFGRNVSTPDRTRALVERLASAIEAATGRRPYVGVDQEGGRVARLRAGATAMPSAMAIGAANDEALAEAAGAAIAADALRFGCDVVFAPVLDLALRAESRVVGTRSFGDDPERVGALGSALGRGLASGGVRAVAKHAPGHGATGVDSHEALPVLDASPETLAARDLVPFDLAVRAGVPAVMLAHVVIPKFGALPATLDPRAVALVRASVGDDVLLMTDCLQMQAVAATIGSGEAAARAIAAGVDVAVVSHDLEVARQAVAAIVRFVEDGRISSERLASALAAVERFRGRGATARDTAGLAESGQATAAAIARASLTWLSRAGNFVPYDAGGAVTVVSFEDAALSSAEGQGLAGRATSGRPSLALALRRLRMRAEMMRLPLAPDEAALEALDLVLEGQGARSLVVVARGARFAPAQASAIERLVRAHPQAVVVCAGEPFDAVALADARHVLCCYGDGEPEMDAVAGLLCGRAEATGVAPVRLSS